ncbi:MAG TPA: hypothetical protein VJG90_06655 [Candidatus Nanoarchaeia archaeon]|nr:hypothetical protein [Candidatus Nanoarchaeia archaeon]
MLRTPVARPEITKDFISHLFGRNTYLRELVYQGLTETSPDAFPGLDDGERIVLLSVLTQSRRPGQGRHWNLGADHVYHPPWEHEGFPAFVQAAETPSQLIKPAYEFGRSWVYGKLNPKLSLEAQEDWKRLSGLNGKDLESRVDINLPHLQAVLRGYTIEELPAEERLMDAFREKPGSDPRISKLEYLRRCLDSAKENRNIALAATIVEQLRQFEVFRRDLLEPARIPVSSERYSSLVQGSADPELYELLHWLPAGSFWKTTANAYDYRIARELKNQPRVYTEPTLSRPRRTQQLRLEL